MVLFSCTLVLSAFSYADYTEPRLYQPYSHAFYQKDLKIYQTLNGHCKSQSSKDKRTDAWHCTSEGKHFDPCFKHKYVNKHELVCPVSPWSHKATRIFTNDVLDSKKNKHLNMSKTSPWAMELTDGTHCVAISPASHLPYKYKCQNHQYLSGNLLRCKGTWQIYRKDEEGTQIAEVKRAWF